MTPENSPRAAPSQPGSGASIHEVFSSACKELNPPTFNLSDTYHQQLEDALAVSVQEDLDNSSDDGDHSESFVLHEVQHQLPDLPSLEAPPSPPRQPQPLAPGTVRNQVVESQEVPIMAEAVLSAQFTAQLDIKKVFLENGINNESPYDTLTPNLRH